MERYEFENFCSGLAKLRVMKGYTQNALAAKLGVTHQAISQWECGDTMPDIMLLPKLAEAFGVSIDRLFGVSGGDTDGEVSRGAEARFEHPKDDGKLRAVVFIGDKMVKSQDIIAKKLGDQKVTFKYDGPALDVESQLSLECGDVGGNASAGHSMTCGSVTGSAKAGHSLECKGNIGQDATAGHALSAGGNIGGSVKAGHSVNCGTVTGNVTAGHGVKIN